MNQLQRNGLGICWRLVQMMVVSFACLCHAATGQNQAPQLSTPDASQFQKLNRTLSLLRSARPGYRPTLRIMVYGQSHSLGEWPNYFAENLRAFYPHANIIITNRAIAGFSALLLSRSVQADVVGWQPDLLLLHCLGSNLQDYHRLYSTITNHCTADVLVHGDHIQTASQATESLDISEVSPDTVWVLRNYHWLPEIVNQYGFCWADIRTPWKEYLATQGVSYRSLLGPDGYHCNDQGHWLTANLIAAFFRPENQITTVDPFSNPKVQTRLIDEDIFWENNELRLRLKGNRVEVIYDETNLDPSAQYEFTFDGLAPDKVADFYDFDRASTAWQTVWPGILAASHESLPVEERWTLHTDSISLGTGQVFFSVEGSKTGKDGSGSNFGIPFVSNSRRLRIEPEAWMQHLSYVATLKMPPSDWKITVDCVLRALPTFQPRSATGAGIEASDTLFQSLTEGEHELVIRPRASGSSGIKGLRVFSPGGQAMLKNVNPISKISLRVKNLGDRFVLTWPQALGQGRLEYSNRLDLGAEWLPVDAPATLQGGSYQLPIAFESSNQRFYRWRP
jgi:hypothetical protein